MLSPQPPGAPIPCGVLTGMGGAESRIVVNTRGVVVFDPAVKDAGPTNCVGRCAQSGIALSRDNGATWSFAESPTGSRVDNSIAADPGTGRLFWIPFSDASPLLDIRISDDDGATWRDSAGCCGSAENPRIVVSKGIVYLCSNTSYAGGLEPAAGSRVCSKSTDAGATFNLIGPLFSKPVPQHRECAPKGEVFGAVDEHYPVPAPDGSLYVLVRCGGAAPASTDTEFLARSTDQGATWPIVHPVPLAEDIAADMDDLRIDTAGNLYIARTEPAKGHPLVRWSRDGGATWSAEVDLAPPAVDVGRPAQEAEGVFTSPQLWEIDVAEPGHVAVGYYAREKGGKRWDGYLTETWNLFDAEPVLWTARLNPDDVDLVDGVTDTIGNDYMGTTIAPNGDAWAGFYHSTGFAGRLTRASSSAAPTPVAPVSGEIPKTGGTGKSAVVALGLLAASFVLRRTRGWVDPARSLR